ncbi:TonB-dependent receptor [Sphingomonas colocasiae]|uniref:TonB-dependent receptor n=1 Tax=Sphingomonas colocasiae TaxID=1848973 RepID=A0ABS7PID9_9SPHN|nr:TonB-dependent receptor [Sphingomonas colocasiae]MBY8821064.1 TonB-dependent receptor [Sphingomonas colocasiae]
MGKVNFKGTRFRLAAAISIAAVAVATTTPAAYAQNATQRFDIPAQPLNKALLQLGRQARISIAAPSSLTKGRTSKAVSGDMTAREALERLLAGSGLEFTFVSANAARVTQAGNAPAPARASADASVGTSVSAPIGTVVDARTGAALKGALVELVETGEKASTGDLGDFRFPGRNGSYNIRISYLGYPPYEQFVDLRSGRATVGILLSDGSAAGEIVVTAYKAGRAQALNQERTAENTSTIISDDLTGKFDGISISDALRRAPGIAFVPTDFNGTGTGDNVIVRGLGPDLNTVTLNGQRLPASTNGNRAPALNNILADSVSKITINKTLLPSQDGSGTGGLVEIETKGPLDRPDRYFSATVEKGFAARDFLDDTGISGTASWRFGASKNFGLSLSAQYRKRNIEQISLIANNLYGAYLPEGVAGTFALDPRTRFPFEAGVDERYQASFGALNSANAFENLNIGAGMQWKIGTHTNLRLDYQYNEAKQDVSSSLLSFDDFNGYTSIPLDSLNGQTRSALVWENFFPILGTLPASLFQRYNFNESKDVSHVVTFNGDTSLGLWDFGYQASYAKGKRRFFQGGFTLSPGGLVAFDRIHLSDELLGNTVNGRVISAFLPTSGSRVQLPSFSSAGFDRLNDPALFNFTGGQKSTSDDTNKRFTLRLDTTRNFETGFLKYIKAGAFYEQSRTEANPPYDSFSYFAFPGIPPANLGLSFEDVALSRIGAAGTLRMLNAKQARSFARDLFSGNVPGVSAAESLSSPFDFDDFTEERDMAAYVQAALQFGKLEIVGGVRFERVKTNSFTLFAPQIISADGFLDEDFAANNSDLVNFRGRHDTFLPRVMINYRPKENLVIRLGYYNAIARPSLSSISQNWQVFLDLQPFYGPQFDQPMLSLISGNPDLKSATTHSFDLSVELYSDDIGVIKAGAFYKPTKNSIMNIRSLLVEGIPDDAPIPDDPRFDTPNLYLISERPVNSPDLTTLWGLEFSIERQFKFLPGLLSGLGVYANYTYTNGSMNDSYVYGGVPEGFVTAKVPYLQQPPHSGTFALTYSKGPVNGSLAYTYQAGMYSGYPAFGFTQQGRAKFDTLDLRLSYDGKLFGSEYRIFFEGSNLLKGPTDVTQSSGDKALSTGDIYPTSDQYLGGRTLRIGLTATF